MLVAAKCLVILRESNFGHLFFQGKWDMRFTTFASLSPLIRFAFTENILWFSETYFFLPMHRRPAINAAAAFLRDPQWLLRRSLKPSPVSTWAIFYRWVIPNFCFVFYAIPGSQRRVVLAFWRTSGSRVLICPPKFLDKARGPQPALLFKNVLVVFPRGAILAAKWPRPVYMERGPRLPGVAGSPVPPRFQTFRLEVKRAGPQAPKPVKGKKSFPSIPMPSGQG